MEPRDVAEALASADATHVVAGKQYGEAGCCREVGGLGAEVLGGRS